MRKVILVISVIVACIGLFFALSSPSPKLPKPFIAFDRSMTKAYPAFPRCYRTKIAERREEWLTVKHLYEKHLSITVSEAPRIPKIIHQIWIGGPLPQKYLALQETWKKFHPDWEYRLWTDADLASFPFTDRARFEQATNLAEKADIFRYEILYQYGGLYVDTDFECLKAFDLLHHMCDFYAGLEAIYYSRSPVKMGNALIASTPGHPILRKCLEKISQETTDGNPDLIQIVSGPRCLTKAFLECCQEGEYLNVAFPFTYFYPLPTVERDRSREEVLSDWVQEESFGVHYWEGSWLKGSSRNNLHD
jgi:inositol phosphorylceramide mannosyltransferase catalytic subunit